MDVDLKLPGAPAAAAAARSVIDSMADQVPADIIDDARLLISEVVTNAILHGAARSGGDVKVRVTTLPNCFRFEVCDGGEGFVPGRPTLRDGQIGGWGLYLVDQIADRWGVSVEDGCLVWFELDHRGTAAA